MIRPLRQRHRRMFAVIGVLLPIAFAAGIVARKPVPNVTLLPVELSKSQRLFTAMIWERQNLFAKVPVHVQLLREAAGTGNYAISVNAPQDFVKPDLLVYWAPANSNVVGAIPDDTILLGAFTSNSPLPLPPEAIGKSGRLVLYSLADHEIVETSKTFTTR